LRIMTSNMVRAIRAVSIERGYDPRDFSLMPFGGAGGLHAVDVARELSIRKILVPLSPGILCAEGVALSDMKESFVATCRTPLDGDFAALKAVRARLSDSARAWFAQAGADGEPKTAMSLDMRYVGQNYELAVALDDGVSDVSNKSRLQQRFFEAHQSKYGHFDPAAPIEIVNVRLTARIASQNLLQARHRLAAATQDDYVADVWFDAGGPLKTQITARGGLTSGQIVAGPAIITQFDATTVVPPGCAARIDDASNIVIEVSP
jgi:N-methylhydantoinase A